ncbi:hypothetical protein D9M72_452710 [compost metagenome]
MIGGNLIGPQKTLAQGRMRNRQKHARGQPATVGQVASGSEDIVKDRALQREVTRHTIVGDDDALLVDSVLHDWGRVPGTVQKVGRTAQSTAQQSACFGRDDIHRLRPLADEILKCPRCDIVKDHFPNRHFRRTASHQVLVIAFQVTHVFALARCLLETFAKHALFRLPRGLFRQAVQAGLHVFVVQLLLVLASKADKGSGGSVLALTGIRTDQVKRRHR